jgi:hypothetical protein
MQGIRRTAFRALLVGAAAATVTGSVFAGGASAAPNVRPAHSSLAPMASIRGFTLTREVRNPDGTVAVTWRSKSGAKIFFLGRPGSKISIITHSVSRRHGHKKTTTTTSSLAVYVPSSTISAPVTWHGLKSESRQLAALSRSTSTDAERGNFPQSVASAFAKDVGRRPAASADSIVNTTCISFFDEVNVYATGCDVRTGLQSAAGNSYLVDDMQATLNIYDGAALEYVDLWTAYTSSTTNNVVHEAPLGSESTNCGGNYSWSVGWFGVGFGGDIDTCGGTESSWGLNEWKGGGSWSGYLGGTGSGGSNTLDMEEAIEDHNTYSSGHTNPTSIFHINTKSNVTSVTTGCDDGDTCG